MLKITTRLLLALALVAGLVACGDDDLTEAPMPPAAEPGLAADGNPLADGGWEPETEEADTPTAPLEHPTDDRLRLTISTTSSLRPNVAVELTIRGVAREAIDGGEVVLALPTRAIMDHALDTGVPEVPAKARWDLPATGNIYTSTSGGSGPTSPTSSGASRTRSTLRFTKWCSRTSALRWASSTRPKSTSPRTGTSLTYEQFG